MTNTSGKYVFLAFRRNLVITWSKVVHVAQNFWCLLPFYGSRISETRWPGVWRRRYQSSSLKVNQTYVQRVYILITPVSTCDNLNNTNTCASEQGTVYVLTPTCNKKFPKNNLQRNLVQTAIIFAKYLAHRVLFI